MKAITSALEALFIVIAYAEEGYRLPEEWLAVDQRNQGEGPDVA